MLCGFQILLVTTIKFSQLRLNSMWVPDFISNYDKVRSTRGLITINSGEPLGFITSSDQLGRTPLGIIVNYDKTRTNPGNYY